MLLFQHILFQFILVLLGAFNFKISFVYQSKCVLGARCMVLIHFFGAMKILLSTWIFG